MRCQFIYWYSCDLCANIAHFPGGTFVLLRSIHVDSIMLVVCAHVVCVYFSGCSLLLLLTHEVPHILQIVSEKNLGAAVYITRTHGAESCRLPPGRPPHSNTHSLCESYHHVHGMIIIACGVSNLNVVI